jgi:hypothetical protein
VKNYCRANADGIAHLFLTIDYGSACVCGRKVFVFSLDAEEPALRDVLQEPAAPWKQAANEERVGNARFLL